MPRPFSIDRRTRLVKAGATQEWSPSERAERFPVHRKTLAKLWRQGRTTPSVAPQPQAGARATRRAPYAADRRPGLTEKSHRTPPERLALVPPPLTATPSMRSRARAPLGGPRKKVAERQPAEPPRGDRGAGGLPPLGRLSRGRGSRLGRGTGRDLDHEATLGARAPRPARARSGSARTGQGADDSRGDAPHRPPSGPDRGGRSRGRPFYPLSAASRRAEAAPRTRRHPGPLVRPHTGAGA